jgi:DNA-binding MarR family transcriptional regulator
MSVRAASRVLARLYDEALRDLGIEMSQLPVLAAAAIRGTRGFMVSELARALVMDRTSVTRAVRPLARARLVRVARSPEDARSRIIFITRAGERALREAYPRWQQVTRRIREVFGPGRVDALSKELYALVGEAPRIARSARRG